jgi:hypothetical protein
MKKKRRELFNRKGIFTERNKIIRKIRNKSELVFILRKQHK